MPWTRGMAWLHYFSYLVNQGPAIVMEARQVTDLLSRAHTWVWALGRLVALLSWIRLFSDRLLGFLFGGRGPCTALSPGLKGEAWSPSLDGDLGP